MSSPAITRPKTGGRQAGTPNKTTAFVRNFFAGVLEDAYNAETPEGIAARELLIFKIRSLELDAKLHALVLAYAAGAPPKAVEHKHTGKLTLEQLVAGVAPETADEDPA